jgi:hypothetical protein
MALPLFKGRILWARGFKDEDKASTKVIVEIQAMVVPKNGGPDPDLTDLDKPENQAVEKPVVTFRLRGENALQEIEKRLNTEYAGSLLKSNQHVELKPGSTIYFNGLGPAEWNGTSYFHEQKLQTMIRIRQNSITGAVTTRIARVMTAGAAAKVAETLSDADAPESVTVE